MELERILIRANQYRAHKYPQVHIHQAGEEATDLWECSDPMNADPLMRYMHRRGIRSTQQLRDQTNCLARSAGMGPYTD